MLARVGLHAPDDRLDEHAGREILPGPLLPLAGGLFQQSFVGFGLDVDAQRRPFGLVDQVDQPLQVHRVVEPRLRLGVDVGQHARRLGQFAERIGVVVGQVAAVGISQCAPVARLGELDPLFVGHFQEQQERDLLDVVTVVDAVVPQRVAETPEFLNDVGHVRHTLHSQSAAIPKSYTS